MGIRVIMMIEILIMIMIVIMINLFSAHDELGICRSLASSVLLWPQSFSFSLSFGITITHWF